MADAALPDDAAAKLSRERRARITTLRLLQGLAACALVVPALFFVFGGWLSYKSTQALSDERIAGSLDVLQEHALKVFQSMNLAIDTIGEVLGDKSNAEIAAEEPQLHRRLREVQNALPEVQSIWIFGPAGHPQVITRETPAPREQDYSEEDYFTGPRDAQGIYIGGMHQSASGGKPYFTFDRARRDAGGNFIGVIEMSLLGSDFTRFYSQLVDSPGLQFLLTRTDGVVLARFPQDNNELRLSSTGGFQHNIAANPDGGFYTAAGSNDRIERRIGYRRVPGLPLYVLAGIETSQIRSEWFDEFSSYLIFGIPAAALLFGALIVVLQRTKRLYDEQDRREAAESLMRQTQRLDSIGHLTGGVAHDFNNLLTIIIGNLDIAQRQLRSWTDDGQVKLGQRLDSAMQGAQRAATLTKRLLAFSRQQPLNPAPLDPIQLLNGLSDFLRRTLGEMVSLEIAGDGVWPVEADAAELEAAVINLAVNARDAMPDGGKLTIEASNIHLDEEYCRRNTEARPGDYVQIAVTDSGVGMSRDVAARAFEPFFTTKQTGHGTGLGLSQVYGFVKQSGGHVKIYSEQNEGTTVKIFLPRFAGKYAPPLKSESKAQRGQPGECILVVEDDAEVRAYVVEALGGLGYDVLHAPDAEQALALLGQHNTVRLLLTDVVMPGTNGRMLADEAQRRQPSLKVVFMTGYSRNAIVHQGRLDPGVDLIQKPITTEQLAAAIRRTLDA
jgi:signal transduction histidine kinase/CheY-like chemotaxis protein